MIAALTVLLAYQLVTAVLFPLGVWLLPGYAPRTGAVARARASPGYLKAN